MDRNRRDPGWHCLPTAQSRGLWWCSCDYLLVWSGDPWSPDNSQHLLDPYSFTHLLHDFLLCGLLALIARRLSAVWQLWLAVSIEAAWEVTERTQ
jgi:hypothetical protein